MPKNLHLIALALFPALSACDEFEKLTGRNAAHCAAHSAYFMHVKFCDDLYGRGIVPAEGAPWGYYPEHNDSNDIRHGTTTPPH